MLVLAIDLGTDMVPAMGLGAEEADSGVMDQPPRSRKERIFNRSLMLKAFGWYGMIGATAGMAGYFFAQWVNGWRPGVTRLAGTVLKAKGTVLANGTVLAKNLLLHPNFYYQATTMTFACIVFTQVAAVFGVRSATKSAFSRRMFKNHLILIGVGVEITLLVLLSYVPFLQRLFQSRGLSLINWAALICIPVIMIALDELRKLILRKAIKRKKLAAIAAKPASIEGK